MVKKYFLFLAVLSLLLVSCAQQQAPGNNDDSGPAQQVEGTYLEASAPSSASVGDAVTVKINVNDVNGLYAYQFEVPYNQQVLEFQSFEVGDFLGEDVFDVGAEAENGVVKRIGVTKLGQVPGADGSGTLATITFNAKTSGNSNLGLNKVTLLNPDGDKISADVVSGSVEVN